MGATLRMLTLSMASTRIFTNFGLSPLRSKSNCPFLVERVLPDIYDAVTFQRRTRRRHEHRQLSNSLH
jgi:hypothetical protein